MTTIIANPIYDAVFKYLMEDQKVAKILLSALLKKGNSSKMSKCFDPWLKCYVKMECP